jgi:predicted GTPase
MLSSMGATRQPRIRTVIVGAAGRDFHNFNVLYRTDPAFDVIAFTASQIEGIAERLYPPTLAGPYYREGIPIFHESELENLIRNEKIQSVIFSYSDISNSGLMQLASRALAAGASFTLPGPHSTMLKAPVPVIAVSAVRTGCGKSQTVRYLARELRNAGIRIAIIRHPMPYGDLTLQMVQRFTNSQDLDRENCTIEEREEYEPHIRSGCSVHVGVDTERVINQAAASADLILWDGGNNDFPFVRPDLHIVLTDALRPGHEMEYYPGQAVLRTADIAIVAKADSVSPAQVDKAIDSARNLCPNARILRGASPVTLDHPELVKGRRALVVEDGPSLSHGGMPWGAGYAAAVAAGASEIVDPRRSATPELARIFRDYPHIGPVLPAMGYSLAQRESLKATIERADADIVIVGTPIDLRKVLNLTRTPVRASYDYAEMDNPGLIDEVRLFLAKQGL